MFTLLAEANSDLNEKRDLLQDDDVNINCVHRECLTLLLQLVKRPKGENMLELINVLIERGIQVNSKDPQGKNVLHYLCNSYFQDDTVDNVDIIKLFFRSPSPQNRS